ncbi:hypothetical protein BGZ76_001992 [Entomortierella beljakovae]|nr:hypothetical protein BGZ76_001992 [Entomortierella beljakovae]
MFTSFQPARQLGTTVQSVFKNNILSNSFNTTPSSLIAAQCLPLRRFHQQPILHALTRSMGAEKSLTLGSQFFQRSIATRYNGSGAASTSKATLFSLSQNRVNFVSRKYTSSSSPNSSSSASASSASSATSASASSTTRILAEQVSHGAPQSVSSTATKVPLTFHEEMTKVRFSFNWWKEWTIIMGVFAVTGSSTVFFVKPVLKDVLSLEGSMKEGPWSYRIVYLGTTLPLYSCILLTVASVAGRRPYFMKVVLRMWGRFLPKKFIQRFQ